MQDSKDKEPEKEYVQNEEESQRIDEERVVQTHSNLGLVDARPGESTFATGTKNHSTELDHAFDEVPDQIVDEVALEDDLSDTVTILEEDSLKNVDKTDEQ
ncbi:hypothetical protein [Persicitalea jodogahamensis]|uniref:Uncharacterized protein n=1 Tax=Persicitalea jodogahamensis TaxID=402147 RepID=A0A8J3DA80_9BACT|nr:hypothetical protein [Persicitalea jodogahamensis]GHB73225.1 hypothetical protein GCM10007390_29180 [Persicitalea jodogahamensis]